jgi:hypothetical protein
MNKFITVLSNRNLFNSLKLVLTVTLLYILTRNIGVGELIESVGYLKGHYLLIIPLLIFIDIAIRACNLQSLLSAKKINIKLPALIYIYLVGGFFGTFLPSSLGTDVARIALLSKRASINIRDSATSIMVMNMISLLSLSVMGLISSIALSGFISNIKLVLLVIVTCSAYILVFPLIMFGRIPSVKFFSRIGDIGIIARIQELSTALRGFGKHKRTLLMVFGISLINHFLGVLVAYTVSMSLQLSTPLSFFLMLMPVIKILRLIPISVAGLGVEQGVFVYVLHEVGAPLAGAFLLSLILSTSMLVFALVGGLIYGAGNLDSILKTRKSRLN